MKEVPGPGAYESRDGKFTDANMLKEPSYRIGTAQRLGDSNLNRARRTPGPGNYNTIETIDRADGLEKVVGYAYLPMFLNATSRKVNTDRNLTNVIV
jgi:hypothetical protein